MTSFLTKEDTYQFILDTLCPREAGDTCTTGYIRKKFNLTYNDVFNSIHCGMPAVKDHGKWYFNEEKVEAWLKKNRPDGIQHKKKRRRRRA